MPSKDSCIRNLARSLGSEYCMRVIDHEKVIYRDFGNGFNVEISGVHTTGTKKAAIIYLWFGERQPECMIVKTVRGVARENISQEVENLYAYSCSLTEKGLNSRDRIFRHKFRIINLAKGGNGMKFKVFYGNQPTITNADRSCFDKGDYKCMALLENKKGMPVVLSQKKDKEFPVWKLEYDNSCLVFASYEEAMDYCNGRFLKPDGKEV